ncbi:MAG: oligopeptide/dipeptide ABC transporter ATP-binding protein [Deltaproteobacteria bacterium]
MNQTILEIRRVTKHYEQQRFFSSKRNHIIKALSDISLCLQKGESLGIVGESGCGKSTLAKIILQLEKPTQGEIIFNGKDISTYTRSERQEYRRSISIVFQDPFSSINPLRTVMETISEPLLLHTTLNKGEREAKAEELIDAVGLQKEHLKRYPHALSGGQRQRIGIARAIAVNPHIIVADEPVSSLDVSVRAQILNLFKDIQEKLLLSYIFISHDMSVVRYISDRIAVMYSGRIVEMATVRSIYEKTLHPYTQLLISAIPEIGKAPIRNNVFDGITNNLVQQDGNGCAFVSRCQYRKHICVTKEPKLMEQTPLHFVACHLFS